MRGAPGSMPGESWWMGPVGIYLAGYEIDLIASDG